MKVTMIVLKLLFLGALFIASNNNLHLNDNIEREKFFNYYGAWIDNLFNQGLLVTGYVVKFEWLPKGNESYANIPLHINTSYSKSKK